MQCDTDSAPAVLGAHQSWVTGCSTAGGRSVYWIRRIQLYAVKSESTYITVTCTDIAQSSIHIKCVSNATEAMKNIRNCSTLKTKAPQPFKTSEPLTQWQCHATDGKNPKRHCCEDHKYCNPWRLPIYANSIIKKDNQTQLYNADTRRFVFISRQSILSVNICHIMVIQTGRVAIYCTILMETWNTLHHTAWRLMNDKLAGTWNEALVT